MKQQRDTTRDFDVIVVGGGHAGCEAYAAACRLGVRAALVVPDWRTVGFQPCNPAIGGPGKGHLVREITALGGLMGRLTDLSGLQFRTLNRRKGPAVQSTRVQTDAHVYVVRMAEALRAIEGGAVIEDTVEALLWQTQGARRHVTGVRLARGGTLSARAVVVAAGTYLRGMLFVGQAEIPGGRQGVAPTLALADSIRAIGLPMMRLKTGTCPRLAGDSIDYAQLEEQHGDVPPPFFDPTTRDYSLPQRPCHLTWTSAKSHEIIARNLTRSALYGGGISGIGARYCPSVETKIARFPEKERHQVFLEPEDQHGKVIYPAGISTSFPEDVQEEMVHAIPGLERARILRYGYAVEYDAVQPQALTPHLTVDGFDGLYFAGQILGTSGYEEAAALGLTAGANAALFVLGGEPMLFGRDQAYLGVMIDDLTGRGVDEPYRMFTSRAEFRLLLREDNADERLFDVAVRVGLLGDAQIRATQERLTALRAARDVLQTVSLTPAQRTNDRLRDLGLPALVKPQRLGEYLHREGVTMAQALSLAPELGALSPELQRRLEIDIKYAGYLARQQNQAQRLQAADKEWLPPQMDYSGIPGLREELQEKLQHASPATLGQASRIPGMTPAAVEILRVYARRRAAANDALPQGEEAPG
ncbi:MAG: tRNA uridine-5-carboxymethylaminomethyl(34) synthesis enzyme MnmG [Proteobacteria bacterium]|nr:tRNA uridine-5-carboxymethylaminomethyl(34) synthesis enzyme MnmG [Pseudomonadota bacterium]